MKKYILGLLALFLVIPAISLSAHGWIGSDGDALQSRQELCLSQPDYASKVECGGTAVNEPQSVGECPDESFETGQVDGKLNSCKVEGFSPLDEYQPNRATNEVVAGQTYDVIWHPTAAHKTNDVVYYISKPGADLTTVEWSDFEPTPIASYNYNGATLDTNLTHQVTIPQNRSGEQMIVAAWDVYDTGSTFYNMIDLNVSASGQPPVTPNVCETPTGLSASNTTTSSTTLSWNKGSNCNNYASTYKVYQNNSVIATTTSTTFTVQNLAPDTTYSFMVEDMSSGKRSNTINIHTAAKTTPQPETCQSPLGLHSMDTTKNSVSLMWNMSNDCMNYTSSYEIYENGYYVGTTSSTSYTVSGLTPNTTYNFYVKDTKNSQVSNTYTVTTLPEENQGGQPTSYPDLVVGQTYNKGDLVTHNGETKEVIQTFTYYGDPNWWNAPSLFKNV